MKISYGTKALLLLAVLASLLSFAKFDHCYNKSWVSPDVYTHACYSDISALFDARGMNLHVWPYSSDTNAVEYPPITGVVMWATALVTPHGGLNYKYYFLINALLIALLFIGTTFLVAKLNPEYWYLLPILPAVVGSLYINWDLWAVITAVGSILLFEREKYFLSSFLLAVSIATKFFPIVLLAPIALIFWRKKELSSGIKYCASAIGIAAAINLPFALTTPSGWWRFFSLNGSRGADFGSLWYALQLLGIRVGPVNLDSILLFVAGIAGLVFYMLSVKRTPSLTQVAFLAVTIFTVSSKVYSPQYVLWLAPLGVIALKEKSLRPAFWIWQGSELLYHVAIWEYLAAYSGGRFGIPAGAYAVATLARIVATIYYAHKIGQSTMTELSTEAQFPLPSAAS